MLLLYTIEIVLSIKNAIFLKKIFSFCFYRIIFKRNNAIDKGKTVLFILSAFVHHLGNGFKIEIFTGKSFIFERFANCIDFLNKVVSMGKILGQIRHTAQIIGRKFYGLLSCPAVLQ
ncbi:MAG: hypothetical protein PUC32_00035 [Oscillospiraceae bacterium]|nr:hypothetical protein [Oscillospiraceae bacterium]